MIYGAKTPETPEPQQSKPTQTPREREWMESAVARPTQRNGSEEPKGRIRAIKKIAEITGQSPNGAATEEYNGLPD